MSTSDPERDGNGDVPSREEDPKPQLDVDTAFAAIIAGWDDEPEGGTGSWPAVEDLEPRPPRSEPVQPSPPTIGPAGPARSGQPRHSAEPPREPEILLPSAVIPGAHHDRSADDGDEFVPPVPPPLPRGDLIGRLAWAGAIGGPLFLLIAVIGWQSAPQLLVLGAVTSFVAGFITLVFRMPRDREDDGDDGAVL